MSTIPVIAKQRAIVYIDGFNFYYGLKSKGWRKFYWLDVVKFFETFMRPHQDLIEVVYFSARPHNQAKQERQDLFFTANRLNPRFRLELGKYLPKEILCRNCNHKHKTYEEKETDVKIATRIISDVVSKKCDITIIVSADSDLIPPIEFVREFKPTHKIFVYFPPKRFSSNLNSLADGTKKLEGSALTFEQCSLPDQIQHPLSGFIIKRPESWK